MNMKKCGIEKGATEYVIVCCSCGREGVHHSRTVKQAIEAWESIGWGVWESGSLCPDCR